MRRVIWTEYLKYRAQLRGFEILTIEEIVRFSEERYFDSSTERMVVVGKHGGRLVMIPYEQDDETVTPITIHSVTRQQINLRLQIGRFRL